MQLAGKNKILKTTDSPVSRPVSWKSFIIPVGQKMSLEKPTGYGNEVLRREREESGT